MMEAVAAVYRGVEGKLSLETVQVDEPGDREIIVRTVGSGVCHTDLMLMDSNFIVPAVLGHEGSGIVEKVGPGVTKVEPGDPVVVSIPSCGRCAPCLQGRPMYCARSNEILFLPREDGPPTVSRDGEEIGSSYASSWITRMITTERCVAKVPGDVPLELLGPLGCGIQTGAGAVINALKAEPGSTIAIYGLGTVGQCAVMGAKISGCSRIIGVDVNESRLHMARELGATHVINAAKEDPVYRIFDLTGEGADYSLECVGIPEVFQNAVYSIHTRGVCGLLGFPPQGTEVSLDMGAILWGRTIKGIIEGDSVIDVFIPKLIDFHKAGKLPFDRLMKTYAFDEVEKACRDLRKGLVFKPILRF